MIIPFKIEPEVNQMILQELTIVLAGLILIGVIILSMLFTKFSKEMLANMKTQEERLQAVAGAVTEVKTQLATANSQLAEIRAKNENPAIEDELKNLEETLGLAEAAVSIPEVSDTEGGDVEDATNVVEGSEETGEVTSGTEEN